MELEQIMKLIEKVSDSTLTAFDYEADGVRITMEHGKRSMEAAVSNEPISKDAPAERPAAPAQEQKSGGRFVTSPLVGTFYAAPSEEAEPFVKVGDTVKRGQVIAIVEAMKLMNEIESEFDGTVTEILVKNGEMVDYGKPLFCIA